ncbi:MAG: hypothetical protein C0506_06395 [Anaerolinea sp.]|nr:hypothetical protein [Anaerolinea sp.]
MVMALHIAQLEWYPDLAFSNAHGVTFAYKRNQVIVTAEAVANLDRFLEDDQWDIADRTRGRDRDRAEHAQAELDRGEGDHAPDYLIGLRGVEVLPLVTALRATGLSAEPNYAMFAQGYPRKPHVGAAAVAKGATPGAFQPGPFYGSPFYGSPFYGSPFYGSPFYGSPSYDNPSQASLGCVPMCVAPVPVAWVCFPPPPPPCPTHPCLCLKCLPTKPDARAKLGESGCGRDRTPLGSGAESVPDPMLPRFKGTRGGATIIVLDTGLAVKRHLPSYLGDLDAGTPKGDRDLPSEDGDQYLDPFAGHGTFVAGVVEQRAPGRNLRVGRVLNTVGVTYEWSLIQKLDSLLAGNLDKDTIINLSFSGFAPTEMEFLQETMKEVQAQQVVVVAAAGNEGVDAPAYPAALPGVVGVGALETGDTPAEFTNHGDWVRACAPGVDIVSCFFNNFNGPSPPANGVDPDKLTGWARWSGTSFAAPAVAAALANEMAASGCSAAEAVVKRVDASGLPTVPGLGTRVKLD